MAVLRVTVSGLGTACLVLAAALTAARVAGRLHVPDIVVSLLLGVLLGPLVLHLLSPQAPAASVVLPLGAAIILYEGGHASHAVLLKSMWLGIVLLATVGVAISAAIVGGLSGVLLSVPWSTALLVGAVLAPTDPASIIPVYARIPGLPRITQTVAAEAAMNDATGGALALVLLRSLLSGPSVGWAGILRVAAGLVQQLGVGLLVGLGVGLALALVLARSSRRAAPAEQRAIGTAVALLGAYFLAGHLGGSAFLAVFVAGLIDGNRRLLPFGEPRRATEEHTDLLASAGLAARGAVFLILGTELSPAKLAPTLLPALLIVALLIVVARPAAVLACLLPDRRARWTWRELAMIAWTRETGVVPAALAGIAAAAGAGRLLVTAVLLAAVVTLLSQATTAGWLARRLGLVQPDGGAPAVEPEAG